MAFESLSEKLQNVFKNLKNKDKRSTLKNKLRGIYQAGKEDAVNEIIQYCEDKF